MLITLSPAKTLNFEPQSILKESTTPTFLKESRKIIKEMRTYDTAGLEVLMGTSTAIAETNVKRFKDWKTPFTSKNAKQAVLAFKGQVYDGLKAWEMNKQDLQTSQRYLRILSGLYGLLKPLDLMQAYRLEMGTKVSIAGSKNLYDFWGDQITEEINRDLNEYGYNTLVNLASNEYFKVVKKKNVQARIITPNFKEERDGGYKMITFYAKVARGLMTRFIIENAFDDPEMIKTFDVDGYRFNPKLSTENEWIFTRKSS
ncbi:MAG: peroxide stress protein YaaA [Pirellulaceae bacterium]